MASFGKPISRKTADRLVAGLVERARLQRRPRQTDVHRQAAGVRKIPPPEIDRSATSISNSPTAAGLPTRQPWLKYTRASGKVFGTYFEVLMWPLTELLRHLKNLAAFINITLEDITRITGTLYSIDEDRAAVPPPADRTLICR